MASEDAGDKGFSLKENLTIATISLFITGGGFATAATLLQFFVETEAANDVQTVLYLTGLGFGGLVLLIKLLDRVSE